MNDMAFDLSSAIETLVARMQSNPEEFDPGSPANFPTKFGWLTVLLRSPNSDHARAVLSCLTEEEVNRLREGLNDISRREFNDAVMALVLTNTQSLPDALASRNLPPAAVRTLRAAGVRPPPVLV